METLTTEEIRLLGVLIEKSLTTPEQYPLTVPALTAGCNQKSNRHPVVEYDEGVVMRALNQLRAKGLADQAPPAPGARSNRYLHKALEQLHWDRRQQAVMAELMLRGPQTPGELRARAARMSPLPDLAAVTSVLQELMAPPQACVALIPRGPGRREDRYAHLLAGSVDATPPASMMEPAPATAPDSLQARLERLEHAVDEISARLARLEARA